MWPLFLKKISLCQLGCTSYCCFQLSLSRNSTSTMHARAQGWGRYRELQKLLSYFVYGTRHLSTFQMCQAIFCQWYINSCKMRGAATVVRAGVSAPLLKKSTKKWHQQERALSGGKTPAQLKITWLPPIEGLFLYINKLHAKYSSWIGPWWWWWWIFRKIFYGLRVCSGAILKVATRAEVCVGDRPAKANLDP